MTADEITGREERIEVMLDPSAAGWRPGKPCPECGHSVVHAIVRAGVRFRSDGSWEFDETIDLDTITYAEELADYYERETTVCDGDRLDDRLDQFASLLVGF